MLYHHPNCAALQARELDEDFLFDADGTVEDSTGSIVDDPFARPVETEDQGATVLLCGQALAAAALRTATAALRAATAALRAATAAFRTATSALRTATAAFRTATAAL